MVCRVASKLIRLTSRSFSISSHLSLKVTVIGAAGGIGQPLSLLLKQCPLIDELALYDIANIPGVTADICHINTRARVTGFPGKENLAEALHQSHVIIIPAGMPRKPGMTRDDLFDSNATVAYEMGKAIAKNCPQAIVGVITNPVNTCVPIICEAMLEEKCFDPRRVLGVTTLDEVRAATFIGIANGIDPATITVPVICGHSGVTIVPLLSQCNPPIKMPDNLAKYITEHVREAGTEVVEAKAGAGSATIAMAWAGAQFAVKIVKALRGDRNVVMCAYIASNVCNTGYFASPILLGRGGVQKEFGLPKMNDFEKELLDNALPQLEKDVRKGIDFVSNNGRKKYANSEKP